MRFAVALLVAVLIGPLAGSGSKARAQEHVAAGLKIYSALNFIPAESEYYGLQIVLLPGDPAGDKVLWRSGSGRLDPPLLLTARRDGGTLHVKVPAENDMEGDWVLQMQGSVLHAAGPRGLAFDLTEIAFLGSPTP